MKSVYSVGGVSGRLRYADAEEKVEARFPEGLEFVGLAAVDEPAAADADGVLARSLVKPIASPPLRELARGRGSAALIVSDATRGVCTARALPHVVKELFRAGLALENLFLIVGIGVHRAATGEEIRSLSGEYAGRLRAVEHRPRDPESLKQVGLTSRGNRILVNREVAEAGLRLSIGKVETHEFAGYSGGRKSILPGVAGEESILFNHRPEMIADSAAVPGRLADNPVHADMLEAARLARLDFCLNIVQNAAGEPLAA
ncbi:MAG: lactate racemase domain-containing protein, partial [Planctomycetota bacterium]|nr:lactate racemase domain-containing protein [Planctomycetota bacterium]